MRTRIATWNVDHASKNNAGKIDAQIKRIININADIWVLTETCQQVDLSKLGYNQVIPEVKNRHNKYWSTIWCRMPIRRVIETYDKVTAVCAEVELSPKINMVVYGTIITWQMDKGHDGKSRPWQEHHKSIIDHGADWHKIITDNKQSIFCLAGDFNQPRDGSSWYFAHGANKMGVIELGKQLEDNDLCCITDEDFFKWKKLENRHSVDHICISARCKECCVNIGVWHDPDLSDHNGVYAELQL